ncbi:MAG TPA: hypothetical protein VJ785_13540 [Anaerolineales bacterium]|nr:hypothetical protein [Anaerolineales bacterium]
MTDVEARRQKATEEITGNEALLEMLETEAAIEMLQWGKEMVSSLMQEIQDLDDANAELILEPRLKAVRRTMRSVGNWAAGKYTEPEQRLQLREDLLVRMKTIYGEEAELPSAEEMDAVLSQVDDTQNSSHQLILKFKELLNETR